MNQKILYILFLYWHRISIYFHDRMRQPDTAGWLAAIAVRHGRSPGVRRDIRALLLQGVWGADRTRSAHLGRLKRSGSELPTASADSESSARMQWFINGLLALSDVSIQGHASGAALVQNESVVSRRGWNSGLGYVRRCQEIRLSFRSRHSRSRWAH